ncbi:MAG: YitT family protein, partial [Exiguobacterium sp.]|nr:YitT family protein [Exiguobacterium sp.]
MKRQQQHLLRQQVWRKLQTISVKDMAWIIAGSFILSFGVNYFTVPNDFSEGGLLGVTIILYYVFGWDLGLTSIIGNGILFIVGYKLLDRRTMVYSVIAVIAT